MSISFLKDQQEFWKSTGRLSMTHQEVNDAVKKCGNEAGRMW